MTKESFMVVSLKEDKAKNLAQVISNDKCRKIINYLTEHDGITETEISKSLDLPLSTVHYNIQQLVKNNLVKAQKFHYSKKGKEIQHYSLTNKYIIFSPKPIYGIKQKLKDILPVVLIVGATAITIRIILPIFSTLKETTMYAGTRTHDMATYTKDIAEESIMQAAPSAAKEALKEATPFVTNDAVSDSPHVIHAVSNINAYVLWFLTGAIFAIGIYLLIDWIKKNKTK